MAKAGKKEQQRSGQEGVTVTRERGEEAEVRGDYRGLGSCAREDKAGQGELLGRQPWWTQLVAPEAEPLGCHRGQWEGH